MTDINIANMTKEQLERLQKDITRQLNQKSQEQSLLRAVENHPTVKAIADLTELDIEQRRDPVIISISEISCLTTITKLDDDAVRKLKNILHGVQFWKVVSAKYKDHFIDLDNYKRGSYTFSLHRTCMGDARGSLIRRASTTTQPCYKTHLFTDYHKCTATPAFAGEHMFSVMPGCTSMRACAAVNV